MINLLDLKILDPLGTVLSVISYLLFYLCQTSCVDIIFFRHLFKCYSLFSKRDLWRCLHASLLFLSLIYGWYKMVGEK